jgi:hypothetical protein
MIFGSPFSKFAKYSSVPVTVEKDILLVSASVKIPIQLGTEHEAAR